MRFLPRREYLGVAQDGKLDAGGAFLFGGGLFAHVVVAEAVIGRFNEHQIQIRALLAFEQAGFVYLIKIHLERYQSCSFRVTQSGNAICRKSSEYAGHTPESVQDLMVCK